MHRLHAQTYAKNKFMANHSLFKSWHIKISKFLIDELDFKRTSNVISIWFSRTKFFLIYVKVKVYCVVAYWMISISNSRAGAANKIGEEIQSKPTISIYLFTTNGQFISIMPYFVQLSINFILNDFIIFFLLLAT